MYSPIPEAWARSYLDPELSRSTLVLANGAGALVGIGFYLRQLDAWPVYAWPMLIDSPLGLALVGASLLTLLPFASTREYPAKPSLDLLNTFAFVYALKYGVWTAVALNLQFSLYFPEAWSYFGILFTHLAMVAEAFLLPYYGRTNRWALGVAAAWLLVNDALDYGVGLHPHLRGPAGVLPYVTVALTVGAVALAAYCFDRA
ncbi:MAG: DUF1405 domain-containing protein [Halobacteriaceae archaeon]